MKNEKKSGKTFFRIIKAYIFGMISGMLLLEYAKNRKRPVLTCEGKTCNEDTEKCK